MNTFYMLATQLLIMTEEAGGLFDFNSTLPLIAIQFVLLVIVLTFIFYKPVSATLTKREEYFNLYDDNLADELYKEYSRQVKICETSLQDILTKVEKEAKANVALNIAKTADEGNGLVEVTRHRLNIQASVILSQIEPEVDQLSPIIKESILGYGIKGRKHFKSDSK
jgi:F-type H+-transporting ATPase subunit b